MKIKTAKTVLLTISRQAISKNEKLRSGALFVIGAPERARDLPTYQLWDGFAAGNKVGERMMDSTVSMPELNTY